MSAKGSEAARTDGGSGVFNYSIARPKLYEETRCKCVWVGWDGMGYSQSLSLFLFIIGAEFSVFFAHLIRCD